MEYGYVKMSCYEAGGICIESERIATSDGHVKGQLACLAVGPHHLCRLQRPSSLRKTGGEGRLLARPRDPSPSVALGRDRLAPGTTRSPSSPAPTCPALGKAKWYCSTPAFTAGSQLVAHNLPCSLLWTTPHAKFSSPNSSEAKTRAFISACSSANSAASAFPSVSTGTSTASLPQ